MKHLLLIAACAVPLAACQTTAGGGSSSLIDEIQAAAVTACAYLPTVETVANILSQNPAVSTASAVADAICKVVKPSTALSARLKTEAPINLFGIKVTGEFVK